MSSKFLYFAYGSNLFAKRIHLNNPSAVRVAVGKINDFQLDFNYYSKRWRGASATIVPKKGSCVWGAVWELDETHMETLDKQEGVHDKIYFPLFVNVISPDGTNRKCRVYQQTNTPECVEKIENLPSDRKPSQVYLNIILNGAKESGLPDEYQEFLKRIPHNGYDGEVEVNISLKE